MSSDMRDAFESNIRLFPRRVRKAFGFLESELDFEWLGVRQTDMGPRDGGRLTATWRGPGVAVQVAWWTHLSGIEVGLCELVHGEVPEDATVLENDGKPTGVCLDSLISMVTDGEVEPLLPDISPRLSARKNTERRKANAARIRTDMPGVLNTLADRLREYGAAILTGDTSGFAAINKHHRDMLARDWGRYPGWQ